jgi:hypothetical protein
MMRPVGMFRVRGLGRLSALHARPVSSRSDRRGQTHVLPLKRTLQSCTGQTEVSGTPRRTEFIPFFSVLFVDVFNLYFLNVSYDQAARCSSSW